MMRRPRPCFMATIGAALLLATAQIAAAQKTKTIPSVFDHSLADVKAPEEVTKAVAQLDKSKTPPDCTSARVTVRASAFSPNDKAFEKSLGEARAQALAEALASAGFSPPQYETDWVPAKARENDTNVEVIFDEDRQGPVLQLIWQPENGRKVKPGQTIKATIRASERQEDGHYNWPTGVQSLQLISDDGVVGKAEDYGKRPPPCVVRTIERSYIVPDSPPPVVHLIALAEDAVGNPSSSDADFPTDGNWHGMLKGHGIGNIYNDTVEVSFNFSVADDGTITGGRAPR
jgi:hypothetical protein